ncbi:hypothetical protein LWI28_024620 [Acer negundo]|uniref:Uncharacterized protein n=1 Tax=Acer negundo TaxID=4023 RepID=A0AAD5JVV1_ACENE|nr:hypothetical protein LWI28_024620 [Acer negundo]
MIVLVHVRSATATPATMVVITMRQLWAQSLLMIVYVRMWWRCGYGCGGGGVGVDLEVVANWRWTLQQISHFIAF